MLFTFTITFMFTIHTCLVGWIDASGTPHRVDQRRRERQSSPHTHSLSLSPYPITQTSDTILLLSFFLSRINNYP